MIQLRSLIFILLCGVSVIPWGMYAAFIWFRPHDERFAVASSFGRHVNWLLKVFCKVDVEIDGLENLPSTPSVVLIKHSSPWETLAQLDVFPRHVIVLKRELMWVPILGWALASIRSISINRRSGYSAVTQVIEQGSKFLSEGTWVTIFPEGTRLKPGKIGRFGLSGALLAIKANAPVIPVAHNAGDHWPSGKLVKTPGTIVMKIGPAIDPAGKSPEQLAEEAKQWMNQAMSDISKSHQTSENIQS